MPWVKIDDHFDEHPKLAKAGPLGWALWMAGLAYSNRNLTDGFIPWSVAQSLVNWQFLGLDPGDERARKVYTVGITNGAGGVDVTCDIVVDLLLDAGLWEEVDGGYCVHDYPVYQPTKQQVLEEREKKQAAGRAGGQASAQARAQASGTADTQAKSNPVPVPVPRKKEETNVSSKEKRAFSIPKDFTVDDEMREWAHTKGFDDKEIADQTEAFTLHFQATGKSMKDWRAAWQGWLRRSREFSPKTSPKDIDPASLPYNHPRRSAATGKAAIG